MKSTANRSGILQMHILPVVFALMFVVIIHRSADVQSERSPETTMAKIEAVSEVAAAQVSSETTGGNGGNHLTRILAIAGPANASMVVMFCKTTTVIAKLARI
ncbi:MAG: hypothetical protein EOO02_17280 [Chitinophagaceae bacterium]|nr:MAG: hypothetical protein EOO02_17280 [Chitinophagaceae bacterium]